MGAAPAATSAALAGYNQDTRGKFPLRSAGRSFAGCSGFGRSSPGLRRDTNLPAPRSGDAFSGPIRYVAVDGRGTWLLNIAKYICPKTYAIKQRPHTAPKH